MTKNDVSYLMARISISTRIIPLSIKVHSPLVYIAVASLFFIVVLTSKEVSAVEGGYSNYTPGTYGDFGAAIEPETKLTLRNDTYYYQADDERSVRSGQLDVGADLTFTGNLTTLLYKPGVEIFGAQYALGILLPVLNLEIESSFKFGNGTFNENVKDESEASGLGDIVLVPWILFWNNGNTHYFLAVHCHRNRGLQCEGSYQCGA